MFNLSMLLTAPANGGSSSIIMIVVWIVVIAAMMFFMGRPQKKEQARREALLNALEAGDTVLTTSGFYGVVIAIDGDTVIVEFGNNKNCRIPMQKAAITEVEKPGDAAAAAEADKKEDK